MLRDTASDAIKTNEELADVSRQLRRYRQGRPRGAVEWQDVVSRLYGESGGMLRPTQVWKRLVDLANGDDDVIHEAITTGDRSACHEVVGGRCAKGAHLHWKHPGSDTLFTVSRKRVLNYLTKIATT